MARTAPAPDIPPTPGMCPHVVVKAGGGAGGGSGSGGAGSGGGGSGGGPGGDGDGSGGGDPGAASGSPDGKKYSKQASESEPIDVATGRVYTFRSVDLSLPGPIPLAFARRYSSQFAHRDVGLGYGWTHSFGWRVEERSRRLLRVWSDAGVWIEVPRPHESGDVVGPYGWSVQACANGYVLDSDDGVLRHFERRTSDGQELLLTAITNRRGQTITLTYDGDRLTEITDTVGRRIKLESTEHGRFASIAVWNAVTNQWVRFQSYGYDDHGNLIAAVDAEGKARRYAYDERHRLLGHTDRCGLTFHFRYDRDGRCVEGWGAHVDGHDPALAEDVPEHLADGTTRARGVHHVKLEYHSDGYVEASTSRQTRQYFANAFGTLDKIVSAGGVVSAEYDQHGLLTSEQDALGGVTQYVRDARGRLLQTTDPLGRTTTLERNERGDVTKVVDPAGGERVFERDRYGALVVARNAVGGVTALRYDERGYPTEVHDPDGGVTRFEYDGYGNCISKIESSGSAWRWTHDFFGRVLEETNPTGVVRKLEWSPRGDLIAEVYPDGSRRSYRYDGESRVVERVDPGGVRWQWRYGGYHRACERIDPLGQSVRLSYGREGELLRARNERGELHEFEYDARLNLIGETFFDGRRVDYRRDLQGRVTAIRAGGTSMDLAYDPCGQLIEKSYWDGATETFVYDPLGNVVEASNNDTICRFERDAIGRVLAELQVVDGREFAHRVELTPAGKRTSQRSTLGLDVQVRRSNGLRAQTVLEGEHAITHSFSALGQEVTRQLPGGARLSYRYDALGQLAATGQSTASAPDDAWTQYQYDANDRLVAVDKSGERSSYQYDQRGRLVGVAKADKETRYDYDATNNLLRSDQSSLRYGPGDRLQEQDVWRFRYDENGRMVERHRVEDPSSSWRYMWSAKGTLREVLRPDGMRVTFRYDAFGRRVEKRVYARQGAHDVTRSLKRFAWDGDCLIHDVLEGDAPSVRSFVYGRGLEPLAQRDGSNWSYFVNDQIGTPVALIDGAGAPVAEVQRTPLGRVEAGGDATPLSFQGQYVDEETGLHYNHHRYYDPDSGRYISPDPLGVAAALNVYARGFEPTADIDLFGLSRTPPIDARTMPSSDPVKAAFDESRAKSGYTPDTGFCGEMSEDFAGRYHKATDGKGDAKVVTMRRPDCDSLGTHPGIRPEDKPWYTHKAAELDDGRVVDVDRGIVYKDRDHWASETVTDPGSVVIDPEKDNWKEKYGNSW